MSIFHVTETSTDTIERFYWVKAATAQEAADKVADGSGVDNYDFKVVSYGKPERIVVDGEEVELPDVVDVRRELLAAAKDAIESLKRLPDVEGAFRLTVIKELQQAVRLAEEGGGEA